MMMSSIDSYKHTEINRHFSKCPGLLLVKNIIACIVVLDNVYYDYHSALCTNHSSILTSILS